MYNDFCKHRWLEVNVSKSKVMVCEREQSESIDFPEPNRLKVKRVLN